MPMLDQIPAIREMLLRKGAGDRITRPLLLRKVKLYEGDVLLR